MKIQSLSVSNRDPNDPRNDSRHRERGPKAFTFTYRDVATASGVTEGTVKVYATAKHPRLDPTDLRSVAAFVHGHVGATARRVDDHELLKLFVRESECDKWRNRWPQFDLFWCPSEGCTETTFEPTFCKSHGGPKTPALRFYRPGHVYLRVGRRYVAFHRLMLEAPAGYEVHHKDFNRWNNRPGNLEALTPEEHRHAHFPKRK
jgi:hypothetical protein